MFKRFLSVLLCAVMLFCAGCEKTQTPGGTVPGGTSVGGATAIGTDSEQVITESVQTQEPSAPITYESCEFVYQMKELPHDPDANVGIYYENGEIYLNQGYIKGNIITPDTKYDNKVFDTDGNLLRRDKGTSGDNKNQDLTMLRRGDYWFEENGQSYYLYVTPDWERNCYDLYLNDTDGNAVRVATLSGQCGMSDEYILNEQYFMFIPYTASQRLYIYDRNFNVIADQQLYQIITGALMLSETEVLLLTESDYTYIYDIKKNQINEAILYEDTNEARKATKKFYTEDAVYLICEEGVYVQRGGEQSLICDFARSYVSVNDLEFIEALPNDRFLIKFNDLFLGKTIYAIYMPTEEKERPAREEVRIALIGNSFSPIGEYSVVNQAVTYFNRNNDTYVATFTDYDYLGCFREDGSLDEKNMITRRESLFTQDILDGVYHDVYLFGQQYDDYKRLQDKGVFRDMSALAEDFDIIPSVQGAMLHDTRMADMLYTVPFTVTFKTLVTTTDTLPRGESFTFDRLIDIFNTLGDGEALFDTDASRTLEKIMLSDYLDRANNTCSYDSAEFIRAISFLSEWDKADTRKLISDPTVTPYQNNTVGYIQYLNDTAKCYGDIIDALGSGAVRFLEFNVICPETVPILYSLFDKLDADYNLCGYPSADGGSLYMIPNLLISLGDGDNPAGAEAFVEMMLSETVQCSVGSFPVVRSAVEARMSRGEQYFEEYPSSSIDKRFPSSYRICFLEASTFALAEEPTSATNAVTVLKPEHDAVMAFFCNGSTRSDGDKTVRAIVDEELSAAASGVRSIADAAKLIQSRVFIYINE